MKQYSLLEPIPIENQLRPLRPRQSIAIENIKQSIREGHKRIVLQAPCGFGKTISAAHIIDGALRKGKRPMFTCPAITLVEQTLKAFEADGIQDFGVMQAQHERTDRHAKVQIASVQTLIRRAVPDVDFVLIDEVHENFDGLNELLDGVYKDKIVIGLSATPWTKGMGRRWTKLVIAATIKELVDEGSLCPTELFVPNAIVDRAALKKKRGEFTEESSSEAMKEKRIIGNVVETWKEKGPDGKTFMFCVNRAHAKEQMQAFIDSGIPFGYIDAYTESDDRTRIFSQCRYGEIAGIASVGCLIRGVDEDVRCIIDCDPTNSEKRHVQKWGRGVRTADGKEYLIGLDHAANNTEFGLGLFWEIRHDHLDMHDPADKNVAYEGEKRPPKPRMCQSCRALIPSGMSACPRCKEAVKVSSDVIHQEGELVMYGSNAKPKAEKAEASKEVKQLWYSGFLKIARERGHSDGWAAYRYREKFKVWPRGLDKVMVDPPSEVRKFDNHCRIRYAKSKSRA